MKTAQYFETSVFLFESDLTRSSKLGFKYIFVPASNMDLVSRIRFEDRNAKQADFLQDFYQDIGADRLLLFAEDDLREHMDLMPFVLMQTLTDDGYAAIDRIQAKKESASVNYFEIDFSDPAQLELVAGFESMWTSPLVPYQNSPLEKISVQDVIEKGSGVGIGAALGFAVAAGTPYLFITVPAGMLICASVAGIAKALEKGLYSKIMSLLGLEQEDA